MSGLGLLLIIILFSSIPAGAVYLWFRAARYPFPPLRFATVLLTGGAALFPALFLQHIFPAELIWIAGRWGVFVETFVRVALTEELSRLIALFVLFAALKQIAASPAGGIGGGAVGGDFVSGASGGADEPDGDLSFAAFIQGSAIGLVAGLGFAILESAAYGALEPNVVLIRALTAAPLHGACGSRIGSAAVMFRDYPGQAFFRFLSAVAIHGIYNFMIIIPGIPSIAAVLIALSALASSILAIRGGMSLPPKSPPADSPTPPLD